MWSGKSPDNTHWRKHYWCRICVKYFALTHTGWESYICSQCNTKDNIIVAVNVLNLLRTSKAPQNTHWGKSHTNVTSVKDALPNWIKTENSWKSHIGVKIYQCRNCDLKQHKRTHPGEKPYHWSIVVNVFHWEVIWLDTRKLILEKKLFSFKIFEVIF